VNVSPAPLLLSVVVPCFNEATGLAELHRRVCAACEPYAAAGFELVLVNDGSSDATWAEIVRLRAGDARVVGLDLSRNFGHQLALSAGLEFARGERILVLDADLQDPPELLGAMMAKMDEGADVVFGVRERREGETLFKRASASFFYRVLERLAETPIPRDTGDFRLMNRRVCEALRAMPERQRFVRGMVAWLGFRQEPVLYVRQQRFAGESGYPLGKMIAFALDAITSFSVNPLRLAVYISLALFALSLLLVAYVLVSWLFFHAVVGWASLGFILAFLGAGQFLVLGVLGEYLGRVYVEAKGRPRFVVREILGSRGEGP
jgi:glycosyltransferase involved in cell wall biosynthesis